MEAENFQRVMSLFKEACQLIEPQRTRYLDAQCGSNVALRARVDAMLAEDSDGKGVIGKAGGGQQLLAVHLAGESIIGRSSQQADSDPVPTLKGQYKIIRVIGEGGMGTVYEAEQSFPRRNVALKAIRRGLVSREILRRFEHEAHILGRLHHPGIAQIYEAGAAQGGDSDEAFIAMELVDGRPLTEYARAEGLDLRARLELIIRVCDAIQHAHQRGVIHRDLKPGNILVDKTAQPKVLDFGVARSIDSDLQLTTMHTVSGQLIGTLPYMSPEQVSGNPDDIDTRSDVYGIGVILFELLAGRLPHNLARLSFADAARELSTKEPPLLGTIDRSYRGEVEIIVGKALAREKIRRYQSAGDLGGDLRRYLNGEPIEARRDSTLYVLRKSMRRHRVAVFVAAGFMLLVTTAAIALGISYRKQGALLTEVERRATAETEARRRAEREAAKAVAVSQFVQTMLASADPTAAKGAQVTVRDVLDKAAARIDDGSLRDQPDIEAAVRHTIGETYRSLAMYPPAATHLRKALALREKVYGSECLEVADTLDVLAGVLRETKDSEDGVQLSTRALEINAKLLGKKDPRYAKSLVLQADLLRGYQMDFTNAEKNYREAIAIYDEHFGHKNPHTAAALGNLGAMYADFFRYADAETTLREATEMAAELYGPDHRVYLVNANNYATILFARGKLADAKKVVRPALQSAIRIYGPEHSETGRLMNLAADIAIEQGNSTDAVQWARGALTARRKCLPPGHEHIEWSTILLAEALAGTASAEAANEAARLLEPILAASETDAFRLGWRAFEAGSVWGATLAALHRFDEAEPLLLSNLEKIKNAQGPKSRPTRRATMRLIHMYQAAGKSEEAAFYQSALDAMQPAQPVAAGH